MPLEQVYREIAQDRDLGIAWLGPVAYFGPRGGTSRLRTLAELRRLDAGYRFTRDGGQTHPYRGRGLRIPTLGEALESFPPPEWKAY